MEPIVLFGIQFTFSWEVCTQAAGIGGDTDAIAAIAGAMVGACTGLSALPPEAVRKVKE